MRRAIFGTARQLTFRRMHSVSYLCTRFNVPVCHLGISLLWRVEMGKQRLVNFALPSKADISQRKWHVRYVPEADMGDSTA